MTVLKDHQFEVLPHAEATDGFVFGIGAEISVGGEGFDPGETEWLTQDAENSRRGTRGFGRDVLLGKTWIWESHTDMEDVEGAVDVLDRFSAAWRPEILAEKPGEVTAIRYRLAGRHRRVFGRPRRYSAPPTNLILSGFVPVTHDFDTVDAYTYDDIESTAEVLYSSSVAGGGFVLPAVFPVATSVATGSGSDQLAVGGNARTYPIIRFNGPWTNPRLDAGDWAIEWTGEIGPGGWVEIDTRPWRLTVVDESGASAAEGLSRQTFLESLYFSPGSRPQVSLGGIATGGSASATIRWRNAWTSI